MPDATQEPIHPGRILDMRLKAVGWTNIVTGKIIGRAHTEVSRMRRAKMGISEATALRIAAAFGDPPEVWLKLKRDFDLVQIRENDQTAIARASNLGRLQRFIPNLDEAVALGWLPNGKSIEELSLAGLDLLGIAEGGEPDLSVYTGAALPKTPHDLLRINAWWHYAIKQAEKKAVQKFSTRVLERVVKREVLGEDLDSFGFERVQEILASAGVRLIVATPPKRLALEGAAQASETATLVLPRKWKDFEQFRSIFFQLIGLLISDEDGKIWLWNGEAKGLVLHPTEQQAIHSAQKLSDLDISLRLYPSRW